MVIAQAHAVDTLHNAFFGWDFIGLEANDFAQGRDGKNVITGFDTIGADKRFGLHGDFAAGARGFVGRETAHEPNGAFAVIGEEKDATLFGRTGDANHRITRIDAQTQTATHRHQPFRKTDGFALAGGNEEIIVATRPTRGCRCATFIDIVDHRPWLQALAQVLATNATHLAAHTHQDKIGATLIGGDNGEFFITA